MIIIGWDMTYVSQPPYKEKTPGEKYKRSGKF